MNENILLVHDCGSKLSRRHAEEAEGKVEILNWDNNSEASNLRKMANVIYHVSDILFGSVLSVEPYEIPRWLCRTARPMCCN